MPRISFIIPVRNDADRLRECLRSIAAASDGIDHEVIVADNGSIDDSSAVGTHSGAHVLSLPGLPVSAVRNRAAAAASAALLAFIDADHVLNPGWTAEALSIMADPTVAAAGAQYSAPRDGNWVQQTYDRLRRRRPGRHETEWLPGGNLVVRRETFEQLGGFDPRLETCEDVDLCQRLRRNGHRILASDGLASVHSGDPRTLGAIFRGELWRGRDNLRVSLRVTPTIRSLPGILLPVANLLALVALFIGAMTWNRGGRWLVTPAAVVVPGTVLLRTLALLRPRHDADRLGWSMGLRALLVAAAFEAGRALGLVSRPGHGVRRRA